MLFSVLAVALLGGLLVVSALVCQSGRSWSASSSSHSWWRGAPWPPSRPARRAPGH